MRVRIALSFVATVLLSVLTTTSAASPATLAPPGSWGMAGHDAAGSNFNPLESTLTASALSGLTYQRSFLTTPPSPADCPPTPPSVAAVNGIAYYLTGDNVEAHRIDTGARLWRTQLWPRTGEMIYAGLAVQSGRVIVGAIDCLSNSNPGGFLASLDARTGKLRWVAVGTAVATFAVSGSTIVYRNFFGEGGKVVAAIDAATGQQRWSALEYMQCGSVVIVGQVVPSCQLASTGRSLILKGLSLTTGRTLWTRPVDWAFLRGDTDTSAGRDLYVRNDSGQIVSLNPATGRTKWRASTETGDVLAVAASRLIVTCGQTDAPALCALSRKDGRRLWKASQYVKPTSATIAAGVIYPIPAGYPLRADTGEGFYVPGYPGGASVIVIARGKLIATLGRIVDIYGL